MSHVEVFGETGRCVRRLPADSAYDSGDYGGDGFEVEGGLTPGDFGDEDAFDTEDLDDDLEAESLDHDFDDSDFDDDSDDDDFEDDVDEDDADDFDAAF